MDKSNKLKEGETFYCKDCPDNNNCEQQRDTGCIGCQAYIGMPVFKTTKEEIRDFFIGLLMVISTIYCLGIGFTMVICFVNINLLGVIIGFILFIPGIIIWYIMISLMEKYRLDLFD